MTRCTSTTSEFSSPLAVRCHENGNVLSEYAVMPERRGPAFSGDELRTQILRVSNQDQPSELYWTDALNTPCYKGYASSSQSGSGGEEDDVLQSQRVPTVGRVRRPREEHQ